MPDKPDDQEADVELRAVAGELYGLAPGEFTAARDARAAQAKKDGDATLAAAVKRLRRPTVGAWLVNRLGRERGDELSQLIELGAAMRAAQSQLAADDLRRLSQQRHQAVAALSRDARQIAEGIGHAVSDSTEREVAGTLEAALADESAGAAVRSGCLTTALSYSGMGPVDLTGRVAAPIPAPAALPPNDDGSDRSRLEDALGAAEAAATEARHQADRLDEAVKAAEAERDRLDQQMHDLQRQLDHVRQAHAGASQYLVDAARERDRAAAEAATSTTRAAETRADLARLCG